MGLQRIGDADIERLLAILDAWAGEGPLERRAAVAAICEPRLLRDPAVADAALDLLARLTESLIAEPERRVEGVRTLRKALGYGWSVAIVAAPVRGRAMFERLAASDDPDIRWIVRENLSKARLRRLDLSWVERLQGTTASQSPRGNL